MLKCGITYYSDLAINCHSFVGTGLNSLNPSPTTSWKSLASITHIPKKITNKKYSTFSSFISDFLLPLFITFVKQLHKCWPSHQLYWHALGSCSWIMLPSSHGCLHAGHYCLQIVLPDWSPNWNYHY